jgi:hypothetical protein
MTDKAEVASNTHTLTESELDKVSGAHANRAEAVWDYLLGQYGFPWTGGGTGGFSQNLSWDLTCRS